MGNRLSWAFTISHEVGKHIHAPGDNYVAARVKFSPKVVSGVTGDRNTASNVNFRFKGVYLTSDDIQFTNIS